jgi:hypothetical protein
MGTALLVLIGVSVLIGIQAQVTKGRTGAAWGFMTFLLLMVIFFMAWPSPGSLATMTGEQQETMARALGFFGQEGFAAAAAILFGAPIMALIVATLPKKK